MRASDVDSPVMASADQVALLLSDLADAEQEHVVVLHLDAQLHVTSRHLVALGTLSQSEVHARDVFREACKRNAYAIIIAHNHPSGDPTPSTHDVRLTTKLVAGGTLLGITVLDHVVIGKRGHVSMRETNPEVFR